MEVEGALIHVPVCFTARVRGSPMRRGRGKRRAARRGLLSRKKGKRACYSGGMLRVLSGKVTVAISGMTNQTYYQWRLRCSPVDRHDTSSVELSGFGVLLDSLCAE
ncbi:UNVERIFIED_CONTAM: hypothetical protein Slati_0400000 [Sesamum latifolium]|uniref:Uncharacterized protein n=1 Tax=Sesamum latifolium TaxID=2727402 RepID=A0AAW2XUU0_9LAMI